MPEENRRKEHGKYKSSREMSISSNLNISESLKASMNSRKGENDQMIDQDLNDIVRMSHESLFDSLKSMKAVVR